MSLVQRPRRLRRTAALRRLVAETRLSPADLILPLFVHEGLTQPSGIPNMPGVLAHTRDSLCAAALGAAEVGVGAAMVFAVPQRRDATGSEATDPEGILCQAVGWIKSETGDALPVIADLCLDEFTDHGHCGVLDARGLVDNDATLIRYAAMSQVLADSGADLMGTSGMMDGQVGAVRTALDEANHTEIGILAYAAKYASAFYGPFRAAVKSELTGDRRTYQQDPANRVEARREVGLDICEGADIVMVKPALAYLDIVADVRANVDVPVAAYVVSGEYAMIEAAAAAGAIDRERAIYEVLLGVKRAGANLLATYWAYEVANWFRAESGDRS